jgi:HD-GYP domain-containing protein (c-di-GMP phosphodiesterase class II)
VHADTTVDMHEADVRNEELIGERRGRLLEPLSRAERLHLWPFALGLLGVAVVLPLVVSSGREVSVASLVIIGLLYAIASSVEFEVWSGSAVPSELALVPALFLLPAPLVPLVVAAALLAADLPHLIAGRRSVERVATTVAYAWYAVPPAIVMILAGEPQPHLGSLLLLAQLLVVQFTTDLVATSVGERISHGIRPLAIVKPIMWVFLVDALLAPVGLVAAIGSVGDPVNLLLMAPLVGLIAVFARERRVRFDGALELSSAYRGTAFLLGDVVDADDSYTGDHSRGVVDLTLAVADEFCLTGRDRRNAEFAALLHDVGKIKVPKDLINKPGPLTPEEFAVVQAHAVEGERMLQQVGGVLAEVGTIVRSHHERFDGRGYPDQLAGEDIPLISRIVCACDSYSAMTTERTYRKAQPRALAIEELRRCAGSQFDPRVVDALVKVLTATEPGKHSPAARTVADVRPREAA